MTPTTVDVECPPPAWVREMFTNGTRQFADARTGIELTHRKGAEFVLVTARARDASNLEDDSFRVRTAECYRAIAAQLNGFTPARFWNHIPQIHAPARDRLDRYMVFNAGRYDAFVAWFGGAAQFDAHLATASGIGHSGSDLIVHCLATDQVVRSVDNPRQIRPYCYSQRFGPQPPCFARATRVGKRLFVGGTASVRGEESMFENDLKGQIAETMANLDSLMLAAGTTRNAFADVRVYCPAATDVKRIEREMREAFAGARRVEIMRAELCRRELLIEVEGLAEL